MGSEINLDTYGRLFEKLHIDPFEFMGVRRSCTSTDLKQRYISLAKKFHPDRQGDKKATEQFKILNACYSFIKESLRNLEGAKGISLGRGSLPGEKSLRDLQPWLKPVTSNSVVQDETEIAYNEEVSERVHHALVKQGVIKPDQTDFGTFNRVFEAQKTDYLSRRGKELTVWKEPQAMESSEKLSYAQVRQSGDAMMIHDARSRIRPGVGADLSDRSEHHFEPVIIRLDRAQHGASGKVAPTWHEVEAAASALRKTRLAMNDVPTATETFSESVARMERSASDQRLLEQRTNREFLERHMGEFTKGMRAVTF